MTVTYAWPAYTWAATLPALSRSGPAAGTHALPCRVLSMNTVSVTRSTPIRVASPFLGGARQHIDTEAAAPRPGRCCRPTSSHEPRCVDLRLKPRRRNPPGRACNAIAAQHPQLGDEGLAQRAVAAEAQVAGERLGSERRVADPRQHNLKTLFGRCWTESINQQTINRVHRPACGLPGDGQRVREGTQHAANVYAPFVPIGRSGTGAGRQGAAPWRRAGALRSPRRAGAALPCPFRSGGRCCWCPPHRPWPATQGCTHHGNLTYLGPACPSPQPPRMRLCLCDRQTRRPGHPAPFQASKAGRPA